MKRTSLRSSTALALSAALAFPMPTYLSAGNHLQACGDPVEVPCLTEDGARLAEYKGKRQNLAQCTEDDTLPCLTEDGYLKAEFKGNSDAAQDDTASVSEELPQVGDDTSEAADGATEMANEDEAPDSDRVDATDDADAEKIAEEAAPETIDETVAEAADEAVESTAVEGTGPVGVETDTEGLGEEASDTDMAEDSTEELEPKTIEVEEDTASDDTAAPADDADTDLGAAMAEAGESADATDGADMADAEAPENDGVDEAPAAAAAAAGGDGDTTAEAETPEIETVEVTEETSRSSDEDFETAATGDAAAENTDGDRGLSDFEKALILGLGAAAVGAVLNNGDEVVSNSGDRVVVRRDGELQVLKDDDALLRRPGSEVQTETFNDGSTRTTVTRPNGRQIVTIRSADGTVLRRTRVLQDGTQVVLFDDTETAEAVDVAELTANRVEPEGDSVNILDADEEALRRALAANMVRDTGRTYSLRQVRQIREVRELAPEIELNAVTFASGSAAIQPSQAEELTALGRAMRDVIADNPGEVFLIEGHTDAVGDATYNLALSDRRAETVALALTEYFDVPPENMVTQGYGESALKIQTQSDERANRRATVRRITPLLRMAAN